MPERLSILLISGEYPPQIGGVGDYTQQLGRALCARNHSVRVLTTGAAGADSAPDEPPTLRIGPDWGWRTQQAVVRAVAQLAPDIIHIQYQTGAYGMHPAINLLPWRLRRSPRRPALVVTAHDLRLPYLLPKADRLRGWVTTRLLADADALIVTNAADAAALRGAAPASRELYRPPHALTTPLAIIPIGSNIAPAPPPDYDRAVWRRRLGLGSDATLIGYFGLLSRTKGVLELLAALAQLRPAERYRLLIIGGAAPQPDDQRYAAEVQRFIAAQELSERVQITGPCAPAEVSAHLLAADLVALPFADGASYRRGSLLAALAHGRPTITTAPDEPLDPPLIDGRHALLLADPAPERWLAAIERMAADPALQTRLSAGARELAASFAWPVIAAQHETVYHTVQEAVAKKAHA
jgi:glycosyltransferase involved in cell wall biosynthesis